MKFDQAREKVQTDRRRNDGSSIRIGIIGIFNFNVIPSATLRFERGQDEVFSPDL